VHWLHKAVDTQIWKLLHCFSILGIQAPALHSQVSKILASLVPLTSYAITAEELLSLVLGSARPAELCGAGQPQRFSWESVPGLSGLPGWDARRRAVLTITAPRYCTLCPPFSPFYHNPSLLPLQRLSLPSVVGLTVPLSRLIDIYRTAKSSSSSRPVPACSHIPRTLIPFLRIPQPPVLPRNKPGHGRGCCGATQQLAASLWLWLCVLGVRGCAQGLSHTRPATRALHPAYEAACSSPRQPAAPEPR